ncbi:MAG: hypothetical protein QOD44_1272 [Solirubrobacteraceae bacterium]|jgi:hypothetical protein|nr:hypothetical protein [Solirubrobacteraceae bacterium]
MTAGTITIRHARAADRPVLARLAVLDGARPVRGGTILVAETDGALHAAWSVEERRAIADPFAPTAQEVALLRARARQLTRPSRAPLLRRLARKGLAPAH